MEWKFFVKDLTQKGQPQISHLRLALLTQRLTAELWNYMNRTHSRPGRHIRVRAFHGHYQTEIRQRGF